MGLSYVRATICLLILWAPSALQICLSRNDSCSFYKFNSKLECSGAIHGLGHEEHVKVLEICHFHHPTLHIDDLLNDFPNAEEITISHGRIVKLVGDFPANNFVKVLNLTDLLLEELSGDFLTPLQYLEVLDLRHNRLRYLDVDLVDAFKRIKHVYISANSWNCSLDLKWVTHLRNSSVRDLDYLNCHGRLYTDKPLLSIVTHLENMHANCLNYCKCKMINVVRHPNSEILNPIIQMNCSNLGLINFPERVPEYTRILHLEKNNIEDLSPLINNPDYRQVWDLYLDENLIASIAILEDSYWLSHFRLLSLRDNKLTQLPSYAIDNALQENTNTPVLQMFFGGNPWKCDCLFTPGFQELVIKYNRQFRDVRDIKCSYVEGDENSLLPMIQISRNDVCRSPSHYSINALDLLNCVLASLIIFILSKLAYDYYNFKRTGRLPWIVTKMP